MTSNAEIAKAMADNMTHAAVPLYGKKLRLPDRGAIIGIIKEFRRLLFPAYFGDAQLMALPPENYAALLLERIETALTAQVALALPEGQAFAAAALTHEILEQLPRIQQTLMTDIEATFDGDPAAADKEEIIFAYPGLFAIFVYRIAHELYLRQVPMIPRMMTAAVVSVSCPQYISCNFFRSGFVKQSSSILACASSYLLPAAGARTIEKELFSQAIPP